MSKSFYIIDGHAHIYRAYFAPFRELTGPNGEPTKATYVFLQMLLGLIEQRKPDYLAMVIDAAGDRGTFRSEIYPEYKANREHRPDDFIPQEKRIIQIVKDAGIPLFAVPRVEADDVIATMAHHLGDLGFDTYLVSKDKDLRQILSECVKMYDVQGDTVMDAAAMLQKHGYAPHEAIEVQTLVGDSTDNVPGIPGVGEKTAAKLIHQYGSAQGVLDHAAELTPKLRENIVKYADRIPLSRSLVTLKRDVDFPFDPAQCAFTGLNLPGLRRHLQELEFTSLLKRVESMQPSTPQAAPLPPAPGLFGPMEPPAHPAEVETSENCQYRLIDSDAKLRELVAQLREQTRIAVDTETDALGAMNSNLVGVSFSWEKSHGCYIPVRGPDWRGPADFKGDWKQHVLDQLRPIYENPSIHKVGHNIKYDILVLRQAGIALAGLEMDTMVAAFLIDSGRFAYGIDKLAMDLFHFKKIPTSELLGVGKKQIAMDRVPLEKVACYASEDAFIAFRLADYFRPKLDQVPQIKKLHDELETPLVFVLAEMEFNGVAVDPDILRQQGKVLGERIEELRKRVWQSACVEFNLDSPKQLGDVLFNRLGLKVVKRTKTGPSTDVEVLEKLAEFHECPRLLLEYRSLVKLKNTYLDNLPEAVNRRTGRIHGSFNQTGAATGRLSMSDPNLQNIPIREDEGRRIRLAFVPGDRKNNVLLSADYSQIELRILAHLTGEKGLIRAFEADEDIHRAVAAEVFNVPLEQVTRQQRSQAKIVNFGIIYGVSAHGLARRIEGMNLEGAAALIRAYHHRFPTIQPFMDQCVEQARSQGYVQTILGRRRAVADINSRVGSVARAAQRVAINSVVQGSAADLIKVAMVNIHRLLTSGRHEAKMLLQVHDELVFEIPAVAVEAEAAMIRCEMEQAMNLRVPVKVEAAWGASWGETK